MTERLGFAGKLARVFIHSKLTPLFIVASLLLGLGAVLLLPREEEPQIIVPMIDIFVQMPGASAKEVEERVTKPMEKLLWEIPGVEYIYSTSSPGASMTIVRFTVGEDEEKSIVRLNQKMFANFDLIPPGASQPLIKPRSIDDVPILALTLWSERYDYFMLRRVAAQVHDEIKQVPDVSEVKIIGGRQRQVRVALDKARMAAFSIAPATLVPVLQQSNQQLQSGHFSSGNREFLVETGGFVGSAEELARVGWVCSTIDRCTFGMSPPLWTARKNLRTTCSSAQAKAPALIRGKGFFPGSPYPWPNAREPMPSS
jgi:multidrug efflux pump subunit AcrB